MDGPIVPEHAGLLERKTGRSVRAATMFSAAGFSPTPGALMSGGSNTWSEIRNLVGCEQAISKR